MVRHLANDQTGRIVTVLVIVFARTGVNRRVVNVNGHRHVNIGIVTSGFTSLTW